MPYVTKETKLALRVRAPHTPGELTFLLTKLVDGYVGQNASFDVYAAALGALEATKLELYRRKIATHEDVKIVENGDVYDGDYFE